MPIIRRMRPAPDSHFRLLDCGCGGQAEYVELSSGMFAVRCTKCGRRGRLEPVRHTAQVDWNQRGHRNV